MQIVVPNIFFTLLPRWYLLTVSNLYIIFLNFFYVLILFWIYDLAYIYTHTHTHIYMSNPHTIRYVYIVCIAYSFHITSYWMTTSSQTSWIAILCNSSQILSWLHPCSIVFILRQCSPTIGIIPVYNGLSHPRFSPANISAVLSK